jgi:hypothetical protein
MPSHVGKLTPPRTLQAVMHLPQVHVPHISSLRLRYAFLDYSARLPYHSHLPVSRVEQTHSAGEPIRNYAPLARLRKPSPDRLIIPTPRLLVLQSCTQQEPLPWSSHLKNEYRKRATRAKGGRCGVMAKRVVNNAHISVCGASTHRPASKGLRAREAILSQSSETRPPPCQRYRLQYCQLIPGRPASRHRTAPSRR